MAYGTIKVDTITFTDAGVDKSVTISGLVQNPTFSGNITVTGTVSGNTIQGQTVSGVTVTGTTAVFTSGTFVSLTGTTIQGTTATYATGSFTSLTGTTTSGTTANFASGVFTTQISGATVTGNVGSFTTITGGTVTLTSGVFGAGSAANPSISFTGDANSGLYSPGADRVAISTNGTGRLFVDASGRVGIGTSSAAATLHAVSADNATTGLISGATNAIRFVGNNTGIGGGAIEGVNAAASAFAPLLVGGSDLRFAISGTERARIDSSGRLGIGTSSPDNLLSVRSTSEVINYTAADFRSNAAGTGLSNTYIKLEKGSGFGGAIGGFIEQGVGSGLKLSTLNSGTISDAVVIRDTGRVGIGTSSPGYLLHVNGGTTFLNNLADNASSTVLQLSNNSSTGTCLVKLAFSNGGTVKASINAAVLGNDYLAFNTGSDTERVRIDSSGRLLVGTSSGLGDNKIQVQGDANSSGIFLRRDLPISTIGGNVGLYLATINFGNQDGAIGASIRGETDATWSSGDYPSRLVFSTTADGASSPTERLRITSAGLVGIGASSPGAPLDTRGFATYRGNVYTIASFCANNTNVPLNIVQGIDGTHPSISAGQNSTGTWGALGFVTSEQYRMLITSAGNVGIGTTSPGATLHLYDATASSFRLGQASTTYNSYVDSSNYVCGTITNHPFVFTTNNTERARIDSSGRLLVGTSSNRTGAALQVEGTTFGTSLGTITNNSANSAPAYFQLIKSRGASVGSQALVSNGDGLGNIQFVGADGTQQLVAAAIEGIVDGTPGANDMPGRLVFSTTADGASSPTERMRIASDGRSYFNSSSLTVSATATTEIAVNTGVVDGVSLYNAAIQASASSVPCAYFRRRTSDGEVAQFRRDTTQVGNISVTTTSTAYNTSSDYRLKENVTAVTDGITRLQQLKPARFNFIADPAKTVDGFIAHEVQDVVPEAIYGEKDAVDDEGNPQYQGIDQSKLVPLLTAALQEAVAKIESLEARLTAAGI